MPCMMSHVVDVESYEAAVIFHAMPMLVHTVNEASYMCTLEHAVTVLENGRSPFSPLIERVYALESTETAKIDFLDFSRLLKITLDVFGRRVCSLDIFTSKTKIL